MAHSDFKVETFVSLDCCLGLWLLHEDLERSLVSWRELNHVIGIVVRSIYVSGVEVTRGEFLMI